MGGERGSSKYVPVASKGGGNQARLLEELSLELAMKGEDAGRGEMLPGLGLGLTVAPGPFFLTDPPPQGGRLFVCCQLQRPRKPPWPPATNSWGRGTRDAL